MLFLKVFLKDGTVFEIWRFQALLVSFLLALVLLLSSMWNIDSNVQTVKSVARITAVTRSCSLKDTEVGPRVSAQALLQEPGLGLSCLLAHSKHYNRWQKYWKKQPRPKTSLLIHYKEMQPFVCHKRNSNIARNCQPPCSKYYKHQKSIDRFQYLVFQSRANLWAVCSNMS